MDLALQAFLIAVSFTSASGTLSAETEGCQSPQYIQTGGTGVIHCTFRQDFYGVLWYDSSETNLEVPFLQLIESEKSGYGYNSGKYDVFQNGSLIIKNVSSVHEQTFTVLKFASSDGDPVSFLVDVITTDTLGAETEGCQSPQYIEIGGTGVIHCTFRQDFYGVLWYDSSETNLEVPFLQLIDNEKSGYGYSSGKYDAFQNGSLIIKNVSSIHDQTFTALKFASSDGDPVSFPVDVITTVMSKQGHPFIDVCGSDRGPCFARLRITSVINCFIRGVRPAVNLEWFARTSEGDRNISFSTNVTRYGITYTSNAFISNFFPTESPLRLLVCKADSPPGILREKEMFVLVENGDFSANVKQTEIPIERGHELKLGCSESKADVIVWRKLGDPSEIISNAVLLKDNISQVYSDEYKLDRDGSLIVPHAEVKHEGIYECSFGNGAFGGKQHLNVVVYVPAYPIISGCTPHHYCALIVLPEGNLNCSVTGVRPAVQLEWNVTTEHYSSVITFFDQEVEVIRNGEVFDIYMTSKYWIRQITSRLTVECAISGANIKALALRRQVDLLFTTDQRSNETKSEANLDYLWLLFFIVLVAVCVFTILLCFARKRYMELLTRPNHTHRGNDTENGSRDLPLLQKTVDAHQPDMNRKTLINWLKANYKKEYGSIQPIPFEYTNQFSVNNVYVDCGYRIQTSESKENDVESWQFARSYRDVLSRISSSSVAVIEGDPGCGKSTLTLQLVYDWCNDNEETPLTNKDIIILLKMRDVGGVGSIYAAIKKCILGNTTELTERDIEDTLHSCKSGMIILDGYDEYPYLQMNSSSDFMSIVNKQMFQDFFVLVTTRSFFLLESTPWPICRIKMTGFTEEVQHEYILKAVAKNDSQKAKEIKQWLLAVPNLGLMQVPLVFTMFAHMGVDGKQRFEMFYSFSTVLELIIECFNTHLKNKMKYEDFEALEELVHEHTELDEMAFQNSIKEHTSWDRDKLSKSIGEKLCEYYLRAGIFVEREERIMQGGIGQFKRRVGFYNKVFLQWHAAHSLLRKVSQSEDELQKFAKDSKLFQNRNVLLFACGIDAGVGQSIFKYLKDEADYMYFGILCYLEITKKINTTLSKLIEESLFDITIDKSKCTLNMWSAIQLVAVASRNEIPIECLHLKNCFKSMTFSPRVRSQQSQFRVPFLQTLNHLEIHDEKQQIKDENAEHVLQYAAKCETLKTLSFYECCVPQIITYECLATLESRNVKVSWETYNTVFSLNLQHGRWEFEGMPITDEEYRREIDDIRIRAGGAQSISLDGEDDDSFLE